MPRIDAPTLAEHRDQRLSTLLAAGRLLLAQEGPAAVTMAAVAQRSGLSRPAVYEYFNSTSDLLGAVLLEHMREWTEFVDDALAEITDPATRIDEYVRRSIMFFHQDEHRAMAFLSQATLPADVRERITAEHRSIVQPLITSLDELGIRNAPQAALFVQGVVEAAARQGSEDIEVQTQAAVDFIRAGLKRLEIPT